MMGPGGRGDSCPILMAHGEAPEPGSLVSCDQGLSLYRAEGLSRPRQVSSGWSGEKRQQSSEITGVTCAFGTSRSGGAGPAPLTFLL